MPVDDDAGIGLLLRQHVVERFGHVAERRLAERGLAPGRRESRRKQKCILLAQRHIERACKPQHHVAAGRGTSKLEEAQMPL